MMIKTVNLGELISPAKVRRCNDDEYPVLSMTMHDGIVLQSERFKKSLASLDQSNYKVVSRGQLVVGFPIDEGVIYVQNAADEGIMSPAYGVWDIHAEKVLPEYLECCLHSPQSMSYYMSKLKGTTARRRSITTEDLLSLPISLPDKSEQRRRLSLLSSCKDTISKSEQQLAKLDELVKARFVELFGTGHDGRCEIAMIGSICKFQQGTQIPVEMQIEEPRDGYRRFLRIIDYTQAPQSPRFVNVEGREIDEKSVVIVRYGATAGFVGRGYSGILANNLFEVIPDESVVSKDFLYLALKHGTFERDIHEKAFGAAMPALSFSMMNDIPIVVPSHDEQKRFATFVAEIDKSKLAVKQILEKLETLKKSLMQRYFG